VAEMAGMTTCKCLTTLIKTMEGPGHHRRDKLDETTPLNHNNSKKMMLANTSDRDLLPTKRTETSTLVAEIFHEKRKEAEPRSAGLGRQVPGKGWSFAVYAYKVRK